MPEPQTPQVTVVAQVASQISSREADFEHQWRTGVTASLVELAKGQTDLLSRFSDLREENASQHGEVETQIGRLETKVGAIDKRIDEILIKGLDDADEKLQSKNRLIRGLVTVLVFLFGVIAGGKAHAIGWMKELFP